jgi:hypothetical protein
LLKNMQISLLPLISSKNIEQFLKTLILIVLILWFLVRVSCVNQNTMHYRAFQQSRYLVMCFVNLPYYVSAGISSVLKWKLFTKI